MFPNKTDHYRKQNRGLGHDVCKFLRFLIFVYVDDVYPNGSVDLDKHTKNLKR